MGRMNGCAVWTIRSFSLPGSSNRHAYCDSDRQPDTYVPGNHAEDSSQRGTECNPESSISWLDFHNSLLRGFRFLRFRITNPTTTPCGGADEAPPYPSFTLSATPAVLGPCRRSLLPCPAIQTLACRIGSRTGPALAPPSWRCRR